MSFVMNVKDRQGEVIGLGGPLSRFLRLIRFSHTIFALPFALGALVVAANGLPSLRTFVLVIVCMVFARTAAMLFNRLVDWSLDQRNPRTAARHLLVSKASALVWFVLSSAGFVLAAAAINRLTFLLAPVALALIFFYSFTKRFTSATHFFLGLALAIAPVGAWVARRLSTFDVLLYVAAQLGGAATASYLLRFVVPDNVWSAVALGTPGLASGITRASGMLIEGSLTLFVVLIVFAASSDSRMGGLAGTAVGAVSAAAALCGAPFTGGALNPARAFGPALAAHRWTNQGVYWVGPLAGGLVAAALYNLLFPAPPAR